MMNIRKNTDLGLLWLRLIMGLAIAYHGYGKVFEGHVAMVAEGVAKWGWPMPMAFAWAAALSEFLGGLMIALGLLTRVGALFVFITMCVAFFVAHSSDPFQVKEMAMLYGAMAGMFILTGAGKYSIDAKCCKHSE